MSAPGQALRRLLIDVRPAAGEHAEIYIRRLARANHLRSTYLREYIAGPSRSGQQDRPAAAGSSHRPAS